MRAPNISLTDHNIGDILLHPTHGLGQVIEMNSGFISVKFFRDERRRSFMSFDITNFKIDLDDYIVKKEMWFYGK